MIKNKNTYYILILILSSFVLPFIYGSKGVLPIDSFLIFNGGYNIYNGYHPFKDYWSITGPVLDYIQYIFFLIGGINWISYIAHAALINSILCLFSFFLFIKIGIKNEYALIYALSVSILGYTQTGTPFMDHHAFIFSYLSIGFLLLGLKFSESKYWFLSSFLLTVSFFSKQIPSGYIIIFICFFLLAYLLTYKKKIRNILSFLIGGILGLLIFFLILILNKIPLELFLTQYIFYPLTLGNERLENLNFDISNTVLQFKYLYLAIIPYLLIFSLAFKSKISEDKKKEEILSFSIVLSMFSIFIYSQLMTKNQIIIFFSIPFFLAISHFYNEKFYKNKIVSIFIIAILLISTFKFHSRYNDQRKFMEMQDVDFSLAVNASELDKKLSFLKWINPEQKNDPQREINFLKEIKNILINENKNFILMTDYQILPWLSGAKNISPNKWYDILSVPQKGNPYLQSYISFGKKKLEENNISRVYLVVKNKKYLEDFYSSKNCIEYKTINPISLVASIENCRK